MPLNLEFTTIIMIMLVAAVAAYPLSFMHNRKIGYVSLLQVFYLVILPGVVFNVIFGEMLDIIERPLNADTFLNDKVISVLLMLSLLYTYGGIAIHTLTKTMSRYFRDEEKQGEAWLVNEMFHLGFAHNLIYSGAVLSGTFFALLELNHVSPYGPENGIIISILNGLFIGIATVLGLLFFKAERSWKSLRFFFAAFWIALVITAYAAKPYFHELRQYPLMLTMLVAFSILLVVNLFIYLKRVKGHLRILFRFPSWLLKKIK